MLERVYGMLCRKGFFMLNSNVSLLIPCVTGKSFGAKSNAGNASKQDRFFKTENDDLCKKSVAELKKLYDANEVEKDQLYDALDKREQVLKSKYSPNTKVSYFEFLNNDKVFSEIHGKIESLKRKQLLILCAKEKVEKRG